MNHVRKTLLVVTTLLVIVGGVAITQPSMAKGLTDLDCICIGLK